MSKSQSIGIAVVVLAILAIVSMPALKNAFSAPGIPLREPVRQPAPEAGASAGQAANKVGTADPGTAPEPKVPSGAAASDPASLHKAVASESADASAAGSNGATPGEPPQKPEIVVQVAGAVKKPGVYHLAIGARNDDAVKAAGGLAANANAASVNLAAHATDGAQLYVRNVKEQPTGGVSEDIPPASALETTGAKKPGAPASRHIASLAAAKHGSAGKPAKLKDPSEGKVNINTASAEDLQRIPNIGPAMADKVIAYRQENHGFQSIEDLMQVSGIGAKKFAKMQPFVKIH